MGPQASAVRHWADPGINRTAHVGMFTGYVCMREREGSEEKEIEKEKKDQCNKIREAREKRRIELRYSRENNSIEKE